MKKPRRMADYEIMVRDLENEVERQKNLVKCAVDAGESLRLKLKEAGEENERLIQAIKNIENRESDLIRKIERLESFLRAERKLTEFIGQSLLENLRSRFLTEAG